MAAKRTRAVNSFKGIGRLIRLILRIDRVKLPLWIVLTVGLVALTVPQLTMAYKSEAQRTAYAAATAPSVVTRLWNGAVTGPSIGEITIVETAFLCFLTISLLNIFLVTRHTRKNEESGRSEMLGSLVVGRQAMLSAVLIVVLVVNILCAGLLYLALVSNGLSNSGSMLYASGVGLAGMFFAVTAAVMSQLFQSARAANSASAAVFGVTLMIRGIGDALGTVTENGLGVQTNWISYLSPLGWVTGAKPFNIEQPVWLLLYIPLLAGGLAVAFWLLAHRDMGAGIFATRLGKAHATPALLGRYGLLWRINRTSFISWLIGLILMGATLGGVAKEFESLISGNDEIKELLASFGGGASATDIMFSATFVIAAIAIAAYMVQLLVRMHAEESSGRLGLTLSTSHSRRQWLVTQSSFAFVSGSVILAVTGAVTGLVFGLVAGEPVIPTVTNLTGAIVVQLPAALVLAGAATLLFAVLPRFFVAASWAFLAIALLTFQLGAILKFPQWALNISPFTHTPTAPAADISYLPLVILSSVFVGLCVLSIKLISRRDLITG